MGAPDIKADARRVFEVLKDGGIAITPSSMGYALASSTPQALEKMFVTKKRPAHKRHAMGGNYALHKDLHVMRPEDAEIVRHLTQDVDLPLAVIAPFNSEHPMFKHIDQTTLEALTVDGTLAMLINGGAFQDELADLMMEAKLPLLGSSANISGTGRLISVSSLITACLTCHLRNQVRCSGHQSRNHRYCGCCDRLWPRQIWISRQELDNDQLQWTEA